MLHRESIPVQTLELLERLAESASTAGFYLAVGTALSLRFGHRISVDLDFFKEGAFSVDEMIRLFDIASVNQSASAFNPEKLLWLKQQYIIAMPADQLGKELTVIVESHTESRTVLNDMIVRQHITV